MSAEAEVIRLALQMKKDKDDEKRQKKERRRLEEEENLKIYGSKYTKKYQEMHKNKFAEGGKIEVGNQVEIELNNGKIIIGILEKENPIKVRTDSTSTQVIPNGLIKSIKRSDKYCCGGRFAKGGNVANKGFNYEIGGL